MEPISIDPANANPENIGPINHQPPQTLRPISQSEKEHALHNREVLIAHSRKLLNIFSEDLED